MNDIKLKLALGSILRNKSMLISLLENLNADDVEMGKLNIPASMINQDMRDKIIENGAPYLHEYRIAFENNQIIFGASIDAKQLGEIALMYRFFIQEFEFENGVHRIRLAYEEDAEAKGNAIQSMAFKTAGIGGSYLKIAMDMLKIDFIDVDAHTITVDLDKSKFAEKIPKQLQLRYAGCDDDLLKFTFRWDGE